MICKKCGRMTDASAGKCGHCGTPDEYSRFVTPPTEIAAETVPEITDTAAAPVRDEDLLTPFPQQAPVPQPAAPMPQAAPAPQTAPIPPAAPVRPVAQKRSINPFIIAGGALVVGLIVGAIGFAIISGNSQPSASPDDGNDTTAVTDETSRTKRRETATETSEGDIITETTVSDDTTETEETVIDIKNDDPVDPPEDITVTDDTTGPDDTPSESEISSDTTDENSEPADNGGDGDADANPEGADENGIVDYPGGDDPVQDNPNSTTDKVFHFPPVTSSTTELTIPPDDAAPGEDDNGEENDSGDEANQQADEEPFQNYDGYGPNHHPNRPF